MKKRVIGLLLALVLLMSLLPAGAMASGGEEDLPLTKLWVDGVDMLAEGNNSLKLEGGGTASYANGTLTLTDAIITETDSHGCGIHSDGDLTIMLVGTSTVGNEQFEPGIYVNGDLTITGTGSLTATGNYAGIYVANDLKINGGNVTGNGFEGIYVVGSINVEGGSVTGFGNGNHSRGIHVEKGSITVQNGVVTGNSTGEGTRGIYVEDGNLTVNRGGSVTGNGTGDGTGGIYVRGGDLTVNSGGSVTGIGTDNGKGTESCGILAIDGNLTVNSGGEVTGKGAGAESCGIAVNDLTITGGKVAASSTDDNGYGLYTDNYYEGVTITGTSHYFSASSGTKGTAVFGLIYVNNVEYTPIDGATQITVENGVVTGAEAKPGEPEPGTDPEPGGALYVNGENIMSATDYTVQCDKGTAVYNPNTNTLTLTNAKITETYQQYEGLGIFAKGDLNIELVGTSTVGSDQLGASVYTGGSLTISGTGSLEATGAWNAAGFYVCNNMTVNSGTVIGNNSSDREGIYVSGDMIVNSGGIVRGTGAESNGVYAGTLTVKGGSVDGTGGYGGICAENSMTVYGGEVSGTGDFGIFSKYMTVDGGTVSGTGTGTGAGWGVYTYGLTMTGGTVTGKGENAAIVGFGDGSVEASEIINLPAGYLPEGYELQVVVVEWDDGYSETCAAIVPSGYTFYIDEESGDFVGAAKEVTLKDWQGEDPEQPTTPSDPATPIIPAVPTTPGKDASQQAVDKIESAQGGETVNVDLTTGKTELDKEVFEELSGKDATLEVKVPGGVTWTVNGKDIPAGADLTDLDLSVDMDTRTIPAEAVNSVNSEAGTMQLTVKNDGEFGFTMTLTAPVGAKNAGLWANLYHYDEAAGKLVYTASSLVDGNGYASLPVGSAGQYALVLDGKSHALPFTDLAAGAWYEDAVAYVYRHDLMSGFSEDTFGPNAALSRAQLCQILYNMEGRPAVTGGSSFSDLADGAWYTDAVTWAASQGIVDGYGGGLFGPDDNITREQLASILYRYAQARGDDVSVGEDTNILSYSDAADVAGYAISAMQWACGAGVITGISESALAPRGEATRAQTAAMLMRFCEQYVEW
ncbi:MAG: S-layer homology domain-containing protein [Candidatus Scatomorpha sp.]|jgi:hypothetical protein